MKSQPLIGRAFPIGATVFPTGVNFSLFSRNATSVELLLFDHHEDSQPARVIPLDPQFDKTFYYWHVFVPGLRPGQLYGYRVHGPYEPETGQRFDADKVLVDPYARALMYGDNYQREAARRKGDNCREALKCVVVDETDYDWEGDQPLKRPMSETVIYEMHVAGFTRHASSQVDPARRGTYAGLIEKIPYLVALGVTAVELLPVQQFDEQECVPPLVNYWGYSPIALFAPHRGYSSDNSPLGPVNEFRELVKALHRAGIEVILDVVFNHTAEGDERGATLSMRGIENRAYYILEQEGAHYANYSGCGNTVNCNQSIVRRMIIDCLRYWVDSMHVDGFRFDLASVLSRDEKGRPLESPPVLWSIESDPVLAGTKLIAEAWDIGVYQVGTFVGHRWAEWNGHYRDDLRRFVKGDNNLVRTFADRLTGSPDIYPPKREVARGVNFITCHDGFTLYDLVSYNEKHNEANNEQNRDGANDNYSWNCGQEGPSDDPAIEALRERQMRNLLTLLLLSQGTPMLLAGDELARTQLGNNNAYCQDNELNWIDWERAEQHGNLNRFVRELIRFRQRHPQYQASRSWVRDGAARPVHVSWHGVRLAEPDWNAGSHTLACLLSDSTGEPKLYLIAHLYWEPLEYELPLPAVGCHWRRVIDTSLPAPEDILPEGSEVAVEGGRFLAGARSVVVLQSAAIDV